MTAAGFKQNFDRLKMRFGANAFDDEFIKGVWQIVFDADDYWFTRLCDKFILERHHNKPPLGVDFREAFYNDNQKTFNKTTEKIARSFGSKADADAAYEKMLRDTGAKDLNDVLKHVQKNGPLDMEEF